MHSGIVFIGCLSLISWTIQFLPLISVPITGPLINYGLNFSHYNNYTFGVFGVCDVERDVCSQPAIGYPNTDLFYYVISGETVTDEGFAEIELPSDATHSISKLLVVHVVAFCCTSTLMLECVLLIVVLFLHESCPELQILRLLKKHNAVDVETKAKPRKKDITPYLEWMLVFSLFLFLLTLLAFLADILLFIPRLSFMGWIQLLPILLMALIALLACFMKRSISSRRHLEEESYPADEMRNKHGVMPRWVDDLASDDGFYVYTNGFYSNNERSSPDVQVLQPGRHFHDRSSEDLGEGIELTEMRRELRERHELA